MAFAKRINAFGGELPGMENRTIPDGYAATAENVRLSSNRLDPIYATAAVASGKASANTIHRLLDGTWLSWTEDVDVALSPIAGDTSHRYCFTSEDFEPRVSNAAMSVAGGTPYPKTWYVLGVTPPTTAPGVAISGAASGATETRAYVYTFVTQWGEESAPSPPSTLTTATIGETWTITPTDVAPLNSWTINNVVWGAGVLTITTTTFTFGLRAGEFVTLSSLQSSLNASWQVASVPTTTSFTIAMVVDPTVTDTAGTASRDAPHNTASMLKRIYRSVTTATDTQYYFVKEIPVADVSEVDDVGEDIGEPLPTAGWKMPPVNLQGIKTLPSGAMIGFYENVVAFSEPNIPYAWPEAYENTSDYPIVGLGLIGTAAVVGTQGTPYIIDGVEPATATMTRVDQLWPCVSKAGITSFGNGVFYPTTVGLAYLSFQGNKIVTDTMWSQYEWSDLNPSTFHASTYNGLYYTTQTTDNSETRVLVIAPDKWVTEYNIATDVLYTDRAQGKIFYAAPSGSIYELEPTSGVAQPYVWTSKIYVLPEPINIGAAKITTRFTLTAAERDAVEAYNTALLASFNLDNSGIFCGPDGTDPAELVPMCTTILCGGIVALAEVSNESMQFALIVDDEVIFTKELLDTAIIRPPSGVKYDEFQVRISSNLPVSAILIGETPESLRTV